VRNGVQLITYADRLGGGGLGTIRELLTGPLDGAFTGVHLLPFFTPYDGADAGFDPVDHRAVDPRLGDWEQVARIAETHEVTADLIVNHISTRSAQFSDFQEHGDDSRYAGMFLEFDTVFPDGASAADLAIIYRPRPGLPFTTFTVAGDERRLWTTFTPQQIDLNVSSLQARAYLRDVLDAFAGAGVSQIRLDAIGYAVKTAGTSCFMNDGTMMFIEEIGGEVHARDMASLLEVHSHYTHQLELAGTVDRVYDFALPPLVLHSLYSGSTIALREWLAMSPRNSVTVLDTHDGIGIVDVAASGPRRGLLSNAEIDRLVEGIHETSDGQSRRATGTAATNLDLYQVNCSYYSALGGDDDRYLLARLIQFLSPGIPQVYYAGLFAAGNDMELLAATANGRDINRPFFDRSDVDKHLRRAVVQRLLAMARFRNTHPAFDGDFTVGGRDSLITLSWRSDGAAIEAEIDVAAATFLLRHSSAGVSATIDDWGGF
jgi:sucrose phosphorylase